MEMDQIIRLVQEVSNSNLSSFKYEEDNFTIELTKNKNVNQEAYQSLEELKKADLTKEDSSTGVDNLDKEDEDNDKFTIKSPIVGTFYASFLRRWRSIYSSWR